jgi:hypothetical protein
VALSPESAKGWLALLWPLLLQGGPVVSLVLLLLGAFQIWYLLGAISRVQDNNRMLVERLLKAQDDHRAELLRYVHCQRDATP